MMNMVGKVGNFLKNYERPHCNFTAYSTLYTEGRCAVSTIVCSIEPKDGGKNGKQIEGKIVAAGLKRGSGVDRRKANKSCSVAAEAAG